MVFKLMGTTVEVRVTQFPWQIVVLGPVETCALICGQPGEVCPKPELKNERNKITSAFFEIVFLNNITTIKVLLKRI